MVEAGRDALSDVSDSENLKVLISSIIFRNNHQLIKPAKL